MGYGDDDGVGLAKKLHSSKHCSPFYGVLCYQEIDFLFFFER